MPLRMSTLFVRTLKEDPVDAEVASHRLLHRAGYIRRSAPGIYTWLPLGLTVLRRIENIIREEMNAAGSQEVHFPALLPAEPYQTTGRWVDYGDDMFRLKDRRDNDYILAPTHEEVFTLLVKDLYSSYKDLPLSIYQIQTKYRDEARPRAGILRGREFIMKDAYSFDIDDAGLKASYETMRQAYIRIFDRLGLEYLTVKATAGAMGGSETEEFLHPSEVGEDTFVRSPGGYTANVEAVTTPTPEPLDCSDVPPARVEDTPDTPTIATLVDAANARHPRADRPWTAADTLKNVIVTVAHPNGERELVVIGLPGDREVDLDRAAGSGALGAGEIEVAPATDAEIAAHPGLVKGYVGPGNSIDAPVLGLQGSTGIRFLLDPRVALGSRWITGSNQPGRHVFDLVHGRDFTADGTVEAAEVRAGDPAPDGSGPLELARGVEIGQIFQLGRRYAEALGLQVLDPNGKRTVVTMGSYGIGVTRVMACIAEGNHDDRGLIWPQHLAPADVHIVATGKGEEILAKAEELTAALEDRGVRVLLDDRPKTSPGVKFGDAELLGVPTILVVGRGLAEGTVELRDRRTGQSRDLPVADAVAETISFVDARYSELGAQRTGR
ncbi:proline--tRNA ligase [Brevibacterium daeguense]|uniref:Proline--tRNA ligase n=1 Tax=Brevibacterium daeguense TaxID=909936 RepID=A0ABP8ELX0_9MICO|nr:proline--tRNA ligase [Brevibacterium daeguense]